MPRSVTSGGYGRGLRASPVRPSYRRGVASAPGRFNVRTAIFKGAGAFCEIPIWAFSLTGPVEERDKNQNLNAARYAMEVALAAVATYAQQNAPYRNRTGTTRGGYVTGILDDGRRSGVVVGAVGNVSPWAKFVEFKPGFWVLSGAMRAMRPSLARIFGKGFLGETPGGRAVNVMKGLYGTSYKRKRGRKVRGRD